MSQPDLEKSPPGDAKDDSTTQYGSNHSREASPKAARDPDIVDWDGDDDPANPMNWPPFRKNMAIFIASAATFISPLASSIFAPGVPQLVAEFGNTDDLLTTFVVSVYVLGYAVGPFVLAPSSEVWGRTPTYHIGNLMFLIFTIACAVSTDISMFCVFRFFQGVAGAVPLTNGGATIGDIIPRERRGFYMAIWALGPLLGPVVGPIIGGFLSQAEGWRWTFWLLAIISGVLTITAFIFLRETYAPVVLERKVKKLRKETGNERLRSALDPGLQPRDFFIRAFVRPTKLLFTSPIVILLSLMVSVFFAYIYLLVSTFTIVFETQYGFSTGVSGLTYLGLGLGFLFGLPIVGKGSDVWVKRQTAKNKGEYKPEYRLPMLVFGPWLTAVGLFGYGWTAQEKVHWIAPIILCFPIGLGQLVTFMAVQTYFVDAFGLYAASAIAANTIMRSMFGALIPLAAQPMYDKLGLGWGNSLLAFIALATAPIPWAFIRYGERIRTRYPVKL